MPSSHGPTQDDSEYITAAEVAAAIGVTTRTLRSYVKSGKVRPAATLPSGYMRWTRADLERLRSGVFG
jgi:DNA-binding transcriptional MerR regulator